MSSMLAPMQKIKVQTPKCDICGRFQSYNELLCGGTPDYEDGAGCHAEDLYLICKKCDTGSEPVEK